MAKTKKQKYQLKKIVESLKAYKPQKIILFGSALYENRRSNDIDLFLIKKTKVSRLGRRASRARKYLPDQAWPVDFLIYTPEEVEHELGRNNVFIGEILEKGKLLYEEKI